MSAARPRRLRLACWALAVTLGGLQAWASRHDMNPDGVSYLDLGDAYLRGDLAAAANLYWPPLYPGLLAAALGLVAPAPDREFPLVHLINVVLYLAALTSLEFFLRSSTPPPAAAGTPAWEDVRAAWGYTLFLVAALGLVTVRLVTPDLLVLAAFLLIAGLLCRIADGRAGWGSFLALGALLAAGVLAKTVMLPVALLTLVLAAVAAGGGQGAWARVAAALAVCAVLTAPWIAAMSSAAGRLTLGDNGRLNYIWLVTREFQPPLVSFEGSRPAAWRLAHPPRRLLERPGVYDLASPVGGTLPVWYDPAYWHQGVELRLDVAAQLSTVVRTAGAYARVVRRFLPLVVGAAVLLFLLGVRRRDAARRRREGVLAVLALAPLLGYALVHVEPRYVAGPVVVLGVAALSLVRAPDRRVLVAVAACVLPLQLVPLSIDTVYNASWAIIRPPGDRASASEPWRVAEGLRAAGLRGGDPVAAAGDYFQAGWARLARVRIVAVVDRHERLDCWVADPGCRAPVLAALAATGARALVAEGLPPTVTATPGWSRLGSTDYYIHPLR